MFYALFTVGGRKKIAPLRGGLQRSTPVGSPLGVIVFGPASLAGFGGSIMLTPRRFSDHGLPNIGNLNCADSCRLRLFMSALVAGFEHFVESERLGILFFFESESPAVKAYDSLILTNPVSVGDLSCGAIQLIVNGEMIRSGLS